MSGGGGESYGTDKVLRGAGAVTALSLRCVLVPQEDLQGNNLTVVFETDFEAMSSLRILVNLLLIVIEPAGPPQWPRTGIIHIKQPQDSALLNFHSPSPPRMRSTFYVINLYLTSYLVRDVYNLQGPPQWPRTGIIHIKQPQDSALLNFHSPSPPRMRSTFYVINLYLTSYLVRGVYNLQGPPQWPRTGIIHIKQPQDSALLNFHSPSPPRMRSTFYVINLYLTSYLVRDVYNLQGPPQWPRTGIIHIKQPQDSALLNFHSPSPPRMRSTFYVINLYLTSYLVRGVYNLQGPPQWPRTGIIHIKQPQDSALLNFTVQVPPECDRHSTTTPVASDGTIHIKQPQDSALLNFHSPPRMRSTFYVINLYLTSYLVRDYNERTTQWPRTGLGSIKHSPSPPRMRSTFYVINLYLTSYLVRDVYNLQGPPQWPRTGIIHIKQPQDSALLNFHSPSPPRMRSTFYVINLYLTSYLVRDVYNLQGPPQWPRTGIIHIKQPQDSALLNFHSPSPPRMRSTFYVINLYLTSYLVRDVYNLQGPPQWPRTGIIHIKQPQDSALLNFHSPSPPRMRSTFYVINLYLTSYLVRDVYNLQGPPQWPRTGIIHIKQPQDSALLNFYSPSPPRMRSTFYVINLYLTSYLLRDVYNLKGPPQWPRTGTIHIKQPQDSALLNFHSPSPPRMRSTFYVINLYILHRQ
ncbi:hypothetical protein J6590_058753 [Homalodisca vitripennis]|nr:hypothetical protein J6590_058753 [Homalodisca vitripennis]